MPKYKSMYPEEYDAIIAKLKLAKKPKCHGNRKVNGFSLSANGKLLGTHDILFLVVLEESFQDADEFLVEGMHLDKRMAIAKVTESLLHGKVNHRLQSKYEQVPEEHYKYLSTGTKYKGCLKTGKLTGLEMKAKVDRLEESAEETAMMLGEHGMRLGEHDTMLEDHALKIADLERCDDETIEQFDRHHRAIKKHSAKLEEHDAHLGDHGECVDDHAARIKGLQQKQPNTGATLAQVMLLLPFLQKLQEEQGGIENDDVKMEGNDDGVKIEDRGR